MSALVWTYIRFGVFVISCFAESAENGHINDGDAPDSPLAFPLTQHLEMISATADEREESVVSPSLFDDIDNDDDDDEPLPAPPLHFYTDSQSQQEPDFENNHF